MMRPFWLKNEKCFAKETMSILSLNQELTLTYSLLAEHNMSMNMKNSFQIAVTAERTPNPATYKFKFSQKLLDCSENGGYEFPDAQEAIASPLASKIFGFPWTSQVFLGADFISITKQDWVDWDILCEPLVGLIQEHLEQGLPLYTELQTYEEDGTDPAEDSPLVRKIKMTLQNEIKPMVALDGGDVQFAKLENGILYLKMRGSCAGCPSKSTTLKQGIEVRMRQLYPEIQEVIGL
jgi:NFU1 iron-sulfur cluster scaffold homolog, mitochondrial